MLELTGAQALLFKSLLNMFTQPTCWHKSVKMRDIAIETEMHI